MSGFVRGAIVVAFTLCCLHAAHADHAAKEGAWSEGVSKRHQKQAFEHFDAGNQLVAQGKYTDALVEYEAAITKWDHPAIEFNMMLCLFHMRQPLDAWDHLEKALQYGQEPLGKDIYEQALTYRDLLDAALAQVEVSNDDDGVQVMFDGRELFTGKGSKTIHALAGKHQLVASREGYETESKALDLPAGQTTKEAIALHPEKVKVKVTRENYERRWDWWVPWATLSSGVALALVGTGVYIDARSDIKAYDSELATKCPMGCTPQMVNQLGISNEANHATRVSQIGIGFWSVGAGVAIAAGVMAILNRPQMVTSEHTDTQPEAHPPDVSIIVTPNYVGAGVSLTFR
ncbi:MAG TPA: PEGA domain-containing protein [Kofleriaceae bacterium]